MKTRKEIKQKIEDYELFHNGLKNRSGVFVLARNLRLTKQKAKCDILIFYGEDNHMERYNDCEYPLNKFV